MNDLAIPENRGVSETRSVNEVLSQVEKVKELIEKVLKEGEHYGPSFPGDKKKNLLKPGVDKLLFTFRLAAEYEEKRDDLPNGHREYTIKTRIRSQVSGAVIAEGLGSCSTMESKYRWRNAARICPECGKEAIIKGKAEFGGGWFCSKKKEGCGANFAEDAPEIIKQEVGKYENPDIADTYNTVLKIAKKRSSTDATITALAVSDMFSQDVDELPTDETPGKTVQTKKGQNTKPKQEVAPVAAPDFEARMKAAKELVKTYLSATYKNVLIFSTDEIDLAKKKLVNLDVDTNGKSVLLNEKNSEYLESIQSEYKKIMDKRTDQWKAEDEARAAELDGAADEAFVDDPLPADKKTKVMPGAEGSGIF